MNIRLPYNNVMIDIETLGLTPGCAVLSIGAVQFFPATGEMGREFYVNVDLKSSLGEGMTLDADTVYWWLSQDKAAGEILGFNCQDIGPALRSFLNWYRQCSNGYKIWSNWSGFDFSIMKAAFNLVDVDFLTHKDGKNQFWNELCFGTLKTLFPIDKDVKETLKPEGFVAHNALWDAKWQSKCAMYILNRLETSNK